MRRRFIWVLAPATALAAAIGALAATSPSQSRGTLLRALERPATPAAAPATRTFTRPHGPYRVSLTASPNRAGLPDSFSIVVTDHGRPLAHARVMVIFSMPQMNMWQAFTSHLSERSAGSYRAQEPVLGMSGNWQLQVRVAPPAAPSFSLTLNDPMPA